jgi:hypothetical protein
VAKTVLSRARTVFGVAVFTTLILALSRGSASAGDIRGKVTGVQFLHPSAYASSREHSFTLKFPDPEVPKDLRTIIAKSERDVSVSLYGTGTQESFGRNVVVVLAGGRATPSTVVIPPGIPVLIHNADPFIHHIVGPDGVDGEIAPDKDFQVQPKSTKAMFTDTLIRTVRFWVVADADTIGVARPAPDGSVRLTFQNKGKFVLRAYYEGEPVAQSPELNVPPQGLDFGTLTVASAPPKSSSK